jgi:hypothetical protein
MDISLNIRKRSFSGQYDINKCAICQENETDALEHKKQRGNSDPETTCLSKTKDKRRTIL